MKFIRGGELFTHLKNFGRFKESQVKFFVNTIAIAIGYLHAKNIVYRDIKTENVLMGDDGYLCLTDFGIAKIVEGGRMANTYCGTPEYMAPEIFNHKPYDFSVDWWSIGVLTYELIVGFTPFFNGSDK